jgi:hypothetical protein
MSYEDFTKQINNRAFYVLGKYRNQQLQISAEELHDKFRDDLVEELSKKGYYVKPEKKFYRPKGVALVNATNNFRKTDLFVKERDGKKRAVIVEIKCGRSDVLYQEEILVQVEAQVINTLEYAMLELGLILRVETDNNFNVTVERRRL